MWVWSDFICFFCCPIWTASMQISDSLSSSGSPLNRMNTKSKNIVLYSKYARTYQRNPSNTMVCGMMFRPRTSGLSIETYSISTLRLSRAACRSLRTIIVAICLFGTERKIESAKPRSFKLKPSTWSLLYLCSSDKYSFGVPFVDFGAKWSVSRYHFILRSCTSGGVGNCSW